MNNEAEKTLNSSTIYISQVEKFILHYFDLTQLLLLSVQISNMWDF